MSLFRNTRWSRREVLKQSGMLSALGAATAVSPLAASAAALADSQAKHTLPKREGTDSDNLFTRIGVRPIINGRGTFTIISGSRSLPQVKQAMYDASFYFVHLDEMMDGIGAQLGKLTGAEWGIATTGCEAAICLPPSPASPVATSSRSGTSLHQEAQSGHHSKAFAQSLRLRCAHGWR